MASNALPATSSRTATRSSTGSVPVAWERCFRARDRTTGAEVALKTLTRVEAEGIVLFKREFRSLADLSHPNLVGLYELVADGDLWFFTMELVRGVDFLRHVWGMPRPAPTSTGRTETVPEGALDEATLAVDEPTLDAVEVTLAAPEETLAAVEATRTALEPPTDETLLGVALPPPPDATTGRGSEYEIRLRAALGQLAIGVSALHTASVLHRDLKPHNVLVSEDGRVVLLDFGLALDQVPEDSALDLGRSLIAALRPTCPPSRRRANRWTRPPTGTRWGRSSTRRSRATCPSPARSRRSSWPRRPAIRSRPRAGSPTCRRISRSSASRCCDAGRRSGRRGPRSSRGWA